MKGKRVERFGNAKRRGFPKSHSFIPIYEMDIFGKGFRVSYDRMELEKRAGMLRKILDNRKILPSLRKSIDSRLTREGIPSVFVIYSKDKAINTSDVIIGAVAKQHKVLHTLFYRDLLHPKSRKAEEVGSFSVEPRGSKVKIAFNFNRAIPAELQAKGVKALEREIDFGSKFVGDCRRYVQVKGVVYNLSNEYVDKYSRG